MLAVIAAVALGAGLALEVLAADMSLVANVPLWDVALVACVLALLVSVLNFPQWWTWNGGSRCNGRVCAGARKRRASYTVDLRRARAPRGRPRPDRPGAHRTPRPRTAGISGRSQAEWPLAARRRDSMSRLQRQHGRMRGDTQRG